MSCGDYEIFADCRCTVGEGPLWNDKEKALYWVDLTGGIVYRKKDGTPPHGFEKFKLQIGKIGGMVFTADGALLLFAEKGRVWRWSAEREPVLCFELSEAAESRFNDVIAAPDGGVYCGVAPTKNRAGSLWYLSPSGGFSLVEPDLKGMPNGMGFSPDKSFFYFTVSDERTIYRYSYNSSAGTLSDKRAFIRVPQDEGLPDGMTVDSGGNIWSAQWEGARIVKYSADGEKIAEYRFPISKVTALAFGSAAYDKLFVTTANYPWVEDAYNLQQSGKVFEISDVGIGMKEFEAKAP